MVKQAGVRVLFVVGYLKLFSATMSSSPSDTSHFLKDIFHTSLANDILYPFIILKHHLSKHRRISGHVGILIFFKN